MLKPFWLHSIKRAFLIKLSHRAALESGMSSGFFFGLSNPVGMARRTYDENLDVPLNSPPSDMSVNILWKDPVIPRHRFKKLPEVLFLFYYDYYYYYYYYCYCYYYNYIYVLIIQMSTKLTLLKHWMQYCVTFQITPGLKVNVDRYLFFNNVNNHII